MQFLKSPNFENIVTEKKLIVIHWTAGSFTSAIDWFQDIVSKVSAHYLISVTGTIIQMVDEKNVAWHCNPSNSYYLKKDYGIVNEGLNFCSIGIELEGPPSMLNLSKWQDMQISACSDLCKDIAIRNPGILVTDHSTIDAHMEKRDVKRGVGVDSFPWSKLLELSGLNEA